MDTLKIITAILPLLGVALGAGLQYFFSRSSETRKQLVNLRTEAYLDYLRCVAEIAKIHRDSAELLELLARTAAAKARISIYGSARVLNALAKFERGDPVINSPEAADRFLQLVSTMRQEFAGKNEATNLDDLRVVLFGDR